jgi:hypothetical protein
VFGLGVRPVALAERAVTADTLVRKDLLACGKQRIVRGKWILFFSGVWGDLPAAVSGILRGDGDTQRREPEGSDGYS